MGPLCASEPALVPAGVAGPVTSLVIGPQGRMAAAAGAAVLLLPPSGAGVSAHTLLRPAPDSAGKPIACLAASHDGTLLAAGERGAKPGLYLYRLPAGPCGGVVPPAQELARAQHNFGIQALSFSPSGRLLASHGADKDHQLVLFSPATGGQLGRTRCKESYDALAFLSEEKFACINRTILAVWSLERCITPNGGSLKLSCHAYALPACPAPTRVVGLAALPHGAAPRAPHRLVAVTDSGRLLRLRPGAPTVEKASDLQDTKALAMATSANLLAVGCSGGEVRLFHAASLELAAVLPPPTGANAVLACTLSAEGLALTASYSGAGGALMTSWDLQDVQHPAVLPDSLLPCHSEPISDAALIPTTAAGTCWLLASCGLDRVQLWSLSGGGSLSSLSVLDMHARLGSSSTRLLCLAASSDGQLLAAGDSAGGVHLLSLASPTVPILLASQRVHATEITALGFAPSSGEPVTADGGSLACGAQPLVAVGSRRGGVKVLQWQPDGGALLASLLDHSSAVTGVVLAAGGTALSTAGADGKRMNYRWNAAAGQLQLAAQVAVPRSIFVGLASTLVGVAAANRTGRVYWEAAGKEANVQALQKNQGELTAFAVDPSLSLLVCATSHNSLLALSLSCGKATPVGSCKAAHVAGATISKVIITPDSRWVVTVGDDSAVRTFTLTGSSEHLGFVPPLPAASPPLPVASPPLPAATAATTSSCGTAASGLSSVIQPRNLAAELSSDDDCAGSPAAPFEATASSGRFTTEMGPPPAAAAGELPAGELLELPPGEPAELHPEAAPQRITSIPPSPNRGVLVGGREGMEQTLEELQALFAHLPSRPSTHGGGQEEPLAAAPPVTAPAKPPTASPAAASGLDPASTALDWGSPLETLSSISLGALRSPDVFNGLQSPEPAGNFGRAGGTGGLLSPSSGPAPGAAHDGAAATAASPAPPAGSSKTSKLQRLASMAASARGAFERRSAPAAAHSVPAGASNVGAALDDADTERCRALLHLSDCSDEAGASAAWQAAPTAAPVLVREAAPPTAGVFFSPEPGSATVDVGEEGLGSVSVNQPHRRRSWGPVPRSEPRRTVSAAADLCPEASAAQRPHSALGIATDDTFSVFGDASAGTPPGTAASSAGGVTSRRLSFSFDAGGGGAAHHTIARTVGQDEDTPSWAKLPAASAAPSLPAFVLPVFYTSPGLPAEAQLDATDSTPRLFMGGKAAPAPTAPAAVAAAPAGPAGQPCASVGMDAGNSRQLPPPSDGAGPESKPRGLQGRPSVPRLNLTAAVPHLVAGAAAAASKPAPLPKRRWEASGEAPSPAESSGSTASGFTAESLSEGCGAERPPVAAELAEGQLPEAGAAQAVAEADTPASKKLRKPNPSPPRLVVDCELYEWSAAKAGTAGSRRRSTGVWPAAAGGCGGAFSFVEQQGDAGGEAADPFSMPPSYDPLADDSPADRPGCAWPGGSRTAAGPAPDPSSAVASPASSARASPAPSSPAGSARSGGSTEREPGEHAATPTLSSALDNLRCGLQALTSLGSSALDADAKAELAALLAQIQKAVGLAPLPVPQASDPAPAQPTAGQENDRHHENVSAGSNGGSGCLNPADMAQLKRELLANLHVSLLQELRGGGLS